MGSNPTISSVKLPVSCPVLIENEETFAEDETVQFTSRISAWPEKLIDFEDLGNSEDDGFPDSLSDNRIRRRKDLRVKSAPVRKSKIVPVPFKMTIRSEKY
jgi:hypothetical protein